MPKIDLENIYETFISIPLPFNWFGYIDILRFKVAPLIQKLQNDQIMGWYCFHVHNYRSGVPTDEDDQHAYIHIRLELIDSLDVNKLQKVLPSYCLKTRKVAKESVQNIPGIDNLLLKCDEVEKVWEIIGETSVWILKMLTAHSDNKQVTLNQVGQFLHFFANSLQMDIRLQ